MLFVLVIEKSGGSWYFKARDKPNHQGYTAPSPTKNCLAPNERCFYKKPSSHCWCRSDCRTRPFLVLFSSIFFFPMKGSTPRDFGAAVLHCRDHETLMGMGTGIKCDQSCQGYKTNTNASYPFINPGTLKKLASTFNGITRT